MMARLYQFLVLALASYPIIAFPVTFYPTSSGTNGVTTDSVQLTENIEIYYGLPFAAPPVGALRFKAPQPPSWNVTYYNNTDYLPACSQPQTVYIDFSPISEDCLYLNVYRPLGYHGPPLPVFVYIFGGAFLIGAAQTNNFTDFLSDAIASGQPMIIVTPNYRLGPFGGGYGQEILDNGAANNNIKDINLALAWVTENIGAFGGDSDRVTIGGASAGAVGASLQLLVSTPPRIAGAILNSGSPSANPLAPTNQGFPNLYPLLVNLTGCTGTPNTFECLRQVPMETLVDATAEISVMEEFAIGFPWNPNVDYDFLPDRPHYLLEGGRFLHIPIMAGDDLDEGTAFVAKTTNTTQEVSNQVDYLEPVEPSNAVLAELLNIYPNIPALGSPFDTGNDTFGLDPQYKRIAAIYGDLSFQHSRRWLLEQANANGDNQLWTWLYDAQGNGIPADGVVHTADNMYFLGEATLAASGPGGVNLGEKMLSYWVNFIYNLNPNGESLPYWPTYVGSGQPANMLEFQGTNTTYQISVIQDDYRKAGIAYINQHPVDFNA